MASNSRALGATYAIIAACLWGSSYPAVRIALDGADAIWIALARGVIQSLIVATAIVVSRPTVPRLSVNDALVWIGLGALGGFFGIGMAVAVDLTGATIAGLVSGTYPLVAGVTAPLLGGETLGRRTLVAIIMCALGVWLIANPTDGTTVSTVGLLLAVIAGTTFGVFLPLSRRAMMRSPVPRLMPTFVAFCGLAVEAAIVFALVKDTPTLSAPSPRFALAMSWLVLAAGIAPLFLVESALRRSTTGNVAPYLFAVPLVGALLSVWLLGEPATAPLVAGGALVVAGLIVQSHPTRRRLPGPRPPRAIWSP